MTTEWLNTLAIIMLLIGWLHAVRSIKLLGSMIQTLKVAMELQSKSLGTHILKNQRALMEHKEDDH